MTLLAIIYGILSGVVGTACMIVYFLPALAAANQHHKHAAPIILLNLLTGWTVLGWVVSLWLARQKPGPADRPRTDVPKKLVIFLIASFALTIAALAAQRFLAVTNA